MPSVYIKLLKPTNKQIEKFHKNTNFPAGERDINGDYIVRSEISERVWCLNVKLPCRGTVEIWMKNSEQMDKDIWDDFKKGIKKDA
jgi:hypothetical protein